MYLVMIALLMVTSLIMSFSLQCDVRGDHRDTMDSSSKKAAPMARRRLTWRSGTEIFRAWLFSLRRHYPDQVQWV
jgi:hypothetical protein